MTHHKKAVLYYQQGMTIVEVLIALLIVSFAVTGILRLMLAGDRIGARGSALSSAAILAWNQVESIRQAGNAPKAIGDTSYDATQDSAEFEISRVRLHPSSVDTIRSYGEYAVTVERKWAKAPLICLHLIQGFNRAGSR